jgi:hypothetical protein
LAYRKPQQHPRHRSYKAEGLKLSGKETDIGNGFVMDDFVFDKNL